MKSLIKGLSDLITLDKADPHMTPSRYNSDAVSWDMLGSDVIAAITQLYNDPRASNVIELKRFILIEVCDGLTALEFSWCGPFGQPMAHKGQKLRLALWPLPTDSERGRDDKTIAQHGSIDRAISAAARHLISWTTDPDTFELLQHDRFILFCAWPGQLITKVNPWAYGILDDL
jgi:hypothetical protein